MPLAEGVQPRSYRPDVAARTTTYTYDPLYRLTAADYSTGEFFHYTIDAVGNRLTQVTEAETNTYTYNIANRLTSVDGVSDPKPPGQPQLQSRSRLGRAAHEYRQSNSSTRGGADDLPLRWTRVFYVGPSPLAEGAGRSNLYAELLHELISDLHHASLSGILDAPPEGAVPNVYRH